MNRIPRGNSTTLSHTFYENGVATNPSPDAATVTIIRDDGTVLVAAQPATEAGTGVVTYTLTPAQTAQLDVLTVVWTASFGGQSQTFTDTVEVVGGLLFSIGEARATKPLDNVATYPTDKIVAKRTLAESKLENACGVAFVPRYRRETIDGSGGSMVMLSMPRVTAIRSISLAGTAFTASELAGVSFTSTGLLAAARWTAGHGNYVVVYEHGYADGSERLEAGEAALTWARSLLISGPVDERTTSMSNEDGTYALATPGMRGSVSGIPSVDEFVHRYDMRIAVA